METVQAVANKAGVNLEGVKVHIVEGSDEINYLDLQGACACTDPRGEMRLGPASFSTEEDLAATVAHELTHVQQYASGVEVSTATLTALEAEAEAAEAPALAALAEANAAAGADS